MTKEAVLNLLRQARDKIATAYKDEVIDDVPDNGNLTNMNQAIIHLEEAITKIQSRKD